MILVWVCLFVGSSAATPKAATKRWYALLEVGMQAEEGILKGAAWEEASTWRDTGRITAVLWRGLAEAQT